MDIQKVKAWLDGSRNFIIGRAIYNAYGTNQTFKDILASGKSVTVEKLLVFEMQKLLGTTEVPIKKVPEKIVKPKEENQIDITPASVMANSDDHVLQAIKIEWHKPYKEMCYLIGQLDNYGTSNTPEAINERKEIAARILDLEQTCMQSWAKRDHYLKYGEVPGVKTQVIEIPSNPLELAALINAIKRNIRNNRAAMQKKPDSPIYAKKYLMYKTQYKEITGKNYMEVDNV